MNVKLLEYLVGRNKGRKGGREGEKAFQSSKGKCPKFEKKKIQKYQKI
jgi:hypothetical protein